MLNKKLTLSLLIISLLLVSAGCSNQAQTDRKKQEIYKIGVIAPLSGPASILGQATLNGITLAVEEINHQGGVNGHQIKLLTQDGKFDGKTSTDAAKYLTSSERIDVGSALFELPATAVNPVFEQTQTPLVYQAYVRRVLDNPYAFKTNFDAADGCQEITQYMKDNNKYSQLGVIMSQVSYNDLCLASIKEIEPNIKEYRYTFGEKDFKALLAKAYSDKVDRLMTIAIDYEYIAIFKQLTELALPIKMMCATANECIFPQVKESTPPHVLDSTIAIDFLSSSITHTDFADRMRSKYGNDLKLTDYVYAAAGYEDIMIIAKAFESCQPGDRECIRQALENVKDYNSVIGSHGFKDRVLQLDYQIYEWTSGGWQGVE